MTDTQAWLVSGAVISVMALVLGSFVAKSDLVWFIISLLIVIAAMVLAIILT